MGRRRRLKEIKGEGVRKEKEGLHVLVGVGQE